MRTLLFVIGLTLVSNNCAAELAENRLLYDDIVAREMLVDALKAKKVAYRIDAEGGVWYPAREEKAIDEIAKKIILSRFSGPAASFEDPADVVSFRSKLNQAGISFGTKLQHNREWTTWEKADDLRVREIQEKVDSENMERARLSREKQTSQK